jgi:hypothetical protein
MIKPLDASLISFFSIKDNLVILLCLKSEKSKKTLDTS